MCERCDREAVARVGATSATARQIHEADQDEARLSAVRDELVAELRAATTKRGKPLHPLTAPTAVRDKLDGMARYTLYRLLLVTLHALARRDAL
jgi:hypothetical protein